MIDILLVLLVFFMSISSTEVLQVNKGVVLPVAKDAKDADKNAPTQTMVNILWSSINNSGSIEVDDKKFSLPEQMTGYLASKVKIQTDSKKKTRVLIRADKNVRYEYLKQVMIAAGKAGFGDVTFSVVNKEQ